MVTEIPVISKEIKLYFNDLLGETLATEYFSSVGTPMEEYTLHVFEDLTIIDNVLQKLNENGFEARIHKEYSNLIISTPQGPFKLESQSTMKKIVVDTKASEMIYQGADVYVPGVKRANKIKKGDIVQIVNQQNIHVANAEAKMSHREMLEKRRGIAAKTIQSPYIVPSIEQLNLDNFPVYFQSFPAYLTCLNLDPKPNERILDCCAAPGNKTIHLSEITQDKAKIVAVDRSANRLKKLTNKIERFRIRNIECISGNIIKLSNEWNVRFDKILIDPPCTALGLRPKLSLNTSIKAINSMARYQKSIVHACSQLLRPGGEVIYSTCTIPKEENEDIIEYSEEKLGFKIKEQRYRHSNYSLDVKDSRYPVQRFIPGIHKTNGYFIANLVKF